MKRDEIVGLISETLRANGVRKAFLFGSFARNERTYHDIDVVIEAPKGFSLLDLVRVEQELGRKARKKFDVLTFGGLNPHVKPYIERDLVQIV